MRFFALFTAAVPLLGYALAAPFGGITIPLDTREAPIPYSPDCGLYFHSSRSSGTTSQTSVPSLPGKFSKADANALLDTLKGLFESSMSELAPSSAKWFEKLVA
ncbi:hypothetical protein L198_08068 [Cryptococcus wingfieldii CBS 7118]|uniref:Uncharacterized protein n=1 Tax=Cryptococcus wingfieldii CBS 7118 TaxID=1295528 RepID=A0A1E3HJG3_9TREE|nr:hypothetical protein L198_08068 [Cryptococcus wingfieldii CBS 7118]ODN76473.1 hypothetical protein L198_08068 [Cryptococcus wingfieldii CBS 7118]